MDAHTATQVLWEIISVLLFDSAPSNFADTMTNGSMIPSARRALTYQATVTGEGFRLHGFGAEDHEEDR